MPLDTKWRRLILRIACGELCLVINPELEGDTVIGRYIQLPELLISTKAPILGDHIPFGA